MKFKFHPSEMWYILPMLAYRPHSYISIGWMCVSLYLNFAGD